MSLTTEILDRLTGLTLVKSQIEATNLEIHRVTQWLLDLERRLTRLEATPKDILPPPKRLKH